MRTGKNDPQKEKNWFHAWTSVRSYVVLLILLGVLLFWLRDRQDQSSLADDAQQGRSSHAAENADPEMRRSARMKSSGRAMPEGSITAHTPEQLKDFYLIECRGHQVSIRTALKLLDEAYRDACYFSLEKPLKLQYVVEGQNDKRISFNIKGKKWGNALEYIAALAGMEVKRKGVEVRLVPMVVAKSSSAFFSVSEKLSEQLWQDLIDRGECDAKMEKPDIKTLLRMNGIIADASFSYISKSNVFSIDGTTCEVAALLALTRMEEESPGMLSIRSKLITSPQPLELPQHGLDDKFTQELIRTLMEKEGVAMTSSPSVTTSSGQKATVQTGTIRGEEITGTKLTFTAEPIGLKLAANNLTEFQPTDEKLDVQRSEAQFLVYAGDYQFKAIGQDAGGYHYQVTSISNVPHSGRITRESIEAILNNPNRVANHPVAMAVPGRNGFVFSPYTNQLVDVRDLPQGTLVADPNFPTEDKKFFRVP